VAAPTRQRQANVGTGAAAWVQARPVAATGGSQVGSSRQEALAAGQEAQAAVADTGNRWAAGRQCSSRAGHGAWAQAALAAAGHSWVSVGQWAAATGHGQVMSEAR
jgi:hypothetical protein